MSDKKPGLTSDENHTDYEVTVNGETDYIVKEIRHGLTEDGEEKYLIYGVNDSPPIHITVICALQVGLLYCNVTKPKIANRNVM